MKEVKNVTLVSLEKFTHHSLMTKFGSYKRVARIMFKI